jgi:intraflagellar transport protein 140
VIVWRCDVRGRLTSLCQYRLKSPVTHCVFRNLKSTYDLRTNDSSLFFLAGENGSVNYADDVGHCSEDIKVETNILTMLMLESTDTLVIVTQDLLLSQYAANGGKFAQTIEVC